MSASIQTLAREMMDCVPLIMRAIRTEMRSHREAGLSVVQFRALLHIQRNPRVSLAQVADHLGLTPPSTSTLVEELVQRGLVLRTASTENRRQIQLDLTEPGKKMLASAQELTINQLAGRLNDLTPEEKDQAFKILQRLHSLFE